MTEIEQAIFEDAVDALCNLVAIENHLLESALAKKSTELLKLADEARHQRQKVQLEIFGEADKSNEIQRTGKAELGCSIKHSLMARMTLKEVAQKYITKGEHEKAFKLLEWSNEMFVLLQLLKQYYNEG